MRNNFTCIYWYIIKNQQKGGRYEKGAIEGKGLELSVVSRHPTLPKPPHWGLNGHGHMEPHHIGAVEY